MTFINDFGGRTIIFQDIHVLLKSLRQSWALAVNLMFYLIENDIFALLI